MNETKEILNELEDSILEFYNTCESKTQIENIIELYKNDEKFYNFVQKKLLINKISISYLQRLYNDYNNEHETENIVNDYDYITKVNTTRWI